MPSHASTPPGFPPHPRYAQRTDDGRLQCTVCPRQCRLKPGQRGCCFVRQCIDDRIVLTAYGHPSGAAVDPIEKKPLYHFLPGSTVWSFGTAGCNLTCKFCQNWRLTHERSAPGRAWVSPVDIATAAREAGCHSVAFTYNEPSIFVEYAMDVADACHERGIKTVCVTSGYVGAAARRDLYTRIDAANVDLKAFSEDFYRRMTGGHLAAVLETLRYLRSETPVWLEITVLLIPGYNDADAEIGRLCEWVARELDPTVPVHFSAFHPAHRMLDTSPTPASTLTGAQHIAQSAGLLYAYTGNVRDWVGSTTFCPSCRAEVLVRDGFDVRSRTLDARGRCTSCGVAIAGRFDAATEPHAGGGQVIYSPYA